MYTLRRYFYMLHVQSPLRQAIQLVLLRISVEQTKVIFTVSHIRIRTQSIVDCKRNILDRYDNGHDHSAYYGGNCFHSCIALQTAYASGTIVPYSVYSSPPARYAAQCPNEPCVVTVWLQAASTARSKPTQSGSLPSPHPTKWRSPSASARFSFPHSMSSDT